jgi:hypothetical protein
LGAPSGFDWLATGAGVDCWAACCGAPVVLAGAIFADESADLAVSFAVSAGGDLSATFVCAGLEASAFFDSVGVGFVSVGLALSADLAEPPAFAGSLGFACAGFEA